jgi:hypothetical protein
VLDPRETDPDDGVAETLKSPATTNVTVAVCVTMPLVPLIVSG